MALPELTLPDGTPAFLAAGHAIELVDQYADTAVVTGHTIRRRVYTTTPRTMQVALFLTQAQATAFHEWYEGPLLGGLQYFSAQVKNQGPGLLWWKARFVEPYTAEALENRYWRITAKLLLVGDGTTTAPYVPAMHASAQIALSGSVMLTVPVSLAAAVSIALQPAVFMNASVSIALIAREYRLRQDGSYRLRQDGSKRLLQESAP